MSKCRSLSLLTAVAVFGVAAPVMAQDRSAVTGTDLDAAVAARPGASREAVRSLLSSDEARQVAGQMGMSSDDLSARVAALDGASLDRLAQQAGVNDQILAGGDQKVVISTTVIIIVLLVVILLSV
ncbi:MAG: PA2779 family protein [Gemmatimonadales bacterium]|nr:PA2779 family protein [Gemmatimonadales bacterium]MDZ4390236.1 PA2779 family protein [Gemmatimonadales bacterium]